MVLSPEMENQEEILDALNRFEKKPSDDIPPILEQYLSRVAKTGETLFPWQRVKPLFLNKFDQVTTKFCREFPADHVSPAPNVENVQTDIVKVRIVKALEEFSGAPFTIQRLSEMLIDPQKHYKRIDKFLRGIEKNVQVISTVDPFGNKIISESRALVNGLDSPTNGNDALPTSQPKLPIYTTFPTPQQTNWPTDSWAGVQPSSENDMKNNTQEKEVQSSQENADENMQHLPKIPEKSISESEGSHPSEKEEKVSPSTTQDHNSDSDSDLSSQESQDSDVEHVLEESHSGTVASDSNPVVYNSLGRNESATVSSSDEKVEKEVQNHHEKVELSSSIDSANSSVVVSSTEKEDKETDLNHATTPITEDVDHKSSDVLVSPATTQSTEEDVKSSETPENVDNSGSEKTDTALGFESDCIENEKNVTEETVSRSDDQSGSISSGDVDMTKKCENTITTTSEELRTALQEVNSSAFSEAPVSVVKEEEMLVDNESSSSVVSSNSCEDLQSEMKSSDVTSSNGVETPMEED